MRFAIIGAGNVGSAIAQATTEAGHDVTVAATTDERFEDLTKKVDVTTTTSNATAVKDAEVVVLAVPFAAVEGVVADIADELAGKIVIDATNPLAPGLAGLATDGISGAELVQKAAPKSKVVKAFNTTFAVNMASPKVDGTQLDGFVAGDDADAKEKVLELLEKIGFNPIDVGPLSVARYLEGMAFINISLNANNAWSWQSGWKLVGPTA